MLGLLMVDSRLPRHMRRQSKYAGVSSGHTDMHINVMNDIVEVDSRAGTYDWPINQLPVHFN